MKKSALKITQHQVDAALAQFRGRGGLIHQLPAQRTPPRTIAAGRGAYERIDSLLAPLDLS